MARGGTQDGQSSHQDEGEGVNGRETKKPWYKKVLVQVTALLAVLATAFFTGIGDRLVDVVHKAFADEYRVDAELDRDQLIVLNKSMEGIGGEYLFTSPIREIGKPPDGLDSCDGRHKWARGKGGVDVNATVGRISVYAAPGRSVELKAVQPKPTAESRDPAPGAIATCPGRGGGPRVLGINLDTKKTGWGSDFDEASEETFVSLPVPAGETLVFDFAAFTQSRHWSYRIDLVLSVDGEEEVVSVDDGGKPFQTTAPTGGRSYQWVDDDWLDVTPGQQDPGVADLPDERNPCLLVTSQDVAAEFGAPVRTANPFGSTGTDIAGNEQAAYVCPYTDANGSGLSVGFSVHESPQNARLQYENLKSFYLRSAGETARKVNECGDDAVYLEKTRRFLVVTENRMLDLSMPPTTALVPVDAAATLERLARKGLTRLE
ncbi:hypothetical protein [Saccharothrix sp. Mg75]|uniref:hypothetical protein n=1 Tax=Saccharothrix sp. Mg75 TaxID=3445357 RepID=UPI003EECBF4E